MTLLQNAETFTLGSKDDQARRQVARGVAEERRPIDDPSDSSEGERVKNDLYARLGSSVLNALWATTVIDVSQTLHETIKMVLFDQDKSPETRKIMAEGLESLGQVMLDVDNVQPSTDAQKEQSDHERLAFYGVLEAVYSNDVAAYAATHTATHTAVSSLPEIV